MANTLMDTQKNRLKNLHNLITNYEIVWKDFPIGSEEDLRPFINKKVEVARWCAVTAHVEIRYAYPIYVSFALACNRAVFHANDAIYSEIPIEVFDLDRNKSFYPHWASLLFVKD